MVLSRPRPRPLSFALGASLALASASASAQPPSAEALFHEGVQLMERGEVKTACERFAASYKLDAAPGTLFDLAACHEREGRYGLARQEFLDLAERATNLGRNDKAEVARARAKQIEAHLPKLALDFPANANVTEIMLDGRPVAKEAWSAPIPVDVGSHALEFRAPGKETANERTDTPHASDAVRVRVPFLADAGAASEAPRGGVAPAAPPPAPSPANGADDRGEGRGSGRTLGFVVGGVGIVGLGIGALFGVEALSARSSAEDACGASGRVCLDAAHAGDAQSRLETARRDALVSTVGFGVGVVGLAVGAILVLRGQHSTPSREDGRLRLTPLLGPSERGVALRGAL